MDQVTEIREKIDIVSFIGDFLPLKKAGRNFKTTCPFHNEKTPSFFVSPGRESYYCFGCGAKGDIFTFVEEFEGLDFKGALKLLADRAGVPLPHFNREAESEKEKFMNIMKAQIVINASFFNTHRMVSQYVLKAYFH